MTAALSPVVFDAPLVNPSPTGLFAAVAWRDEDMPLRWLGPGVDVRVFNYGGETSAGVWEADPFALSGDLTGSDVKGPGVRPDFPATFEHFTAWAADDCDLIQASQDEVQTRAQQILRLQEQTLAETVLASRLLTDAGNPATVNNITAAVATLEAALAESNTVGVIHASAEMAAYAASAQLIRYSGTKMLTPMGHQWVFGGGYKSGLGWKLVATSPLYGWRGQVSVRTTIKQEWNRFFAIAERSLTVGYEAALGAALID